MSSVCFSRAACVAVVCLVVTSAFAQAPELISFQGVLTDSGGNPIDSASVGITFKMYKSSTLIWTEPQTVDVTDGVFSVTLGLSTAIAPIAFDRAIELGVTLDGEGVEMTPRTLFDSAPFALGMRGIWTTNAVDGSQEGINIMGGASNNSLGAGAVGATIGGGGGYNNGDFVPNSVSGDWSTIAGGGGNTGEGLFSTIGGGLDNTASASYTTVGGGHLGNASADGATIGGGTTNLASGLSATVGGGDSNQATFTATTVGGGQLNKANGGYSTVSGGYANRTAASYAVVPGGELNQARGTHSFAAGFKSRAKHNGTFVWNDDSSVDDSLLSTGPNQFIIRSTGGVGINRAPVSFGIHLKELADASTYGIRTEASNDSDYWESWVDAANDYNFSYNGSLKAYIQDVDGSYNVFSDAALKEDVQPYPDVLAAVASLRPSTYRFKDGDAASPRSIGLIAQNVEPFFPELVSEKDGLKGLNYAGLSVVAIKAIQELYAIVQAQQAEIERLKAAAR